jgi:DNA-binding GntR family transcriptional regulator
VAAVKQQTQREQAYQHIRRRLIEGSLSTGARLSPTALAREIGMSHTPVREAISQLKSEGLVVHTAHQGAFVRQPTRHELVEIVDIRTTLECNAAVQAARRIGREHLQELDERWQDLCQAIQAFNTPPDGGEDQLGVRWVLADLQFHMVLLRAAGNRLAMRIIEDHRIMTMMFGYRTGSPEDLTNRFGNCNKNLQIHRDIYDAVRRRDPKAARRAMAIHMRRAGKNILARFDWLQRPRDPESSLLRDYPESLREAVRAIECGEPTGS